MNKKQKYNIFSWVALLSMGWLLFFSSCYSPSEEGPEKITSINIIDRNGTSETISSKERLNHFQKTNFFSPQPYQKVLRVYEKDKNGNVRACITSYHPNGYIKQSLEIINNRAFGSYKEWHANGQQKIESYVIGGIADIDTQAEQSWIFEGNNYIWDEEGNLIAEIFYDKGDLEKESKYYHPNGMLWKHIPYHKNHIHGTVKIYLQDGILFQTTEYLHGLKEGISIRNWSSHQLAYQEVYHKDLLMEAAYYSPRGEWIAEIREGNGRRAIFGKELLQELQEYKKGVPEGKVEIFDQKGQLTQTYFIKKEQKEGEDTTYFSHTHQPKLLITWHQGSIEGPVKTWYENGVLESQREMSQNKKNGLSTAWYANGSLMMIEEYENDKLLKGEYYRRGEKIPISKVVNGKGVAMLYNPEGNFSKKIFYQEGRPLEK